MLRHHSRHRIAIEGDDVIAPGQGEFELPLAGPMAALVPGSLQRDTSALKCAHVFGERHDEGGVRRQGFQFGGEILL